MYNPYDFEKYPNRKHHRLRNYDYSTPNYYFVTICTYEKRCIFGEPQKLNAFGSIAQQGIQKIPEHYHGVKIDHFVVMPNHVHILLFINGEKGSLNQIIGTWKAYVSRQVHKIRPDLKVWQDSFHDHIIRNEKSYQNIWTYIEGNPINWEKDCFFVE